jgi:hypothetical protein
MAQERNVCTGPFGAVYDFYIERPLLARLILGAMWGVDPRPFYRSLASVAELPDGATVLDVPCGGGSRCAGCIPANASTGSASTSSRRCSRAPSAVRRATPAPTSN